jgi:AcrR family transcriptional regulator
MARPYRMTARAEAVEENGRRILDAARARFASEWFDQVTLDAIAADAGVTVQTVIRRFGSKDDLVRAIVQTLQPTVASQRGEAPVGDVPGAVTNLVDHYEEWGDEVMHLLRQEQRVPAFGELTTQGKRFHAEWVRGVFAPWLSQREGAARARLHAQLVALCDVYTWYLLRRQRGLSRRQTELALVELLEGLLQ